MTSLKSCFGIIPSHETIDNSLQEAERKKAPERVFLAYFPTSQGEELKALWYEFEAAENSRCCLSRKSLDRLQPTYFTTRH